MALNKTLLAAQGLRCTEEENRAEVEDWGCPAFWGLTAHLEKGKRREPFVNEK